MEFEREAYAPGIAMVGAWFATGDEEPVVRPYIRPDEFTRDVAAEFWGRPQRFGWAFIAGLAAAVFLLMAWFRRAELALYIAVGTSRVELLATLAAECGVVIIGGFVAGLVTVCAFRLGTGEELPLDHLLVALSTAGAGTLAALAGAPLAALAAARGNVAAMLKER